MNEQLSLFDIIDKTFYEKVQDIIDEIIETHDLPINSIHLYSNISSKGINAGKETSRSVCIFEPSYPPKSTASEALGKNFTIINIKNRKNEDIELFIRNKQFESVDVPATAVLKTLKSDKDFQRLIFKTNDENIYGFIRQNILYCLANYESSSSFGCCSKFIECSDAKRCVHENKIYSMGCKYRANLESGKIFYGKNKNI